LAKKIFEGDKGCTHDAVGAHGLNFCGHGAGNGIIIEICGDENPRREFLGLREGSLEG
jgi:hypothetical protein